MGLTVSPRTTCRWSASSHWSLAARLPPPRARGQQQGARESCHDVAARAHRRWGRPPSAARRVGAAPASASPRAAAASTCRSATRSGCSGGRSRAYPTPGTRCDALRDDPGKYPEGYARRAQRRRSRTGDLGQGAVGPASAARTRFATILCDKLENTPGMPEGGLGHKLYEDFRLLR